MKNIQQATVVFIPGLWTQQRNRQLFEVYRYNNTRNNNELNNIPYFNKYESDDNLEEAWGK